MTSKPSRVWTATERCRGVWPGVCRTVTPSAMVSLSVAIILFEGSLTLRWSELRGIGSAVWGLVTIGAVITSVLVAVAAHWTMGIGWPVAFMIGAICSVTGPTVVVPMLRAIRPSHSVANTLRWEGIVIDPIGAMLAVLVFEFIRTRTASAVTLVIGELVLSGVIIGLAAAWALGALLHRSGPVLAPVSERVSSDSRMVSLHTALGTNAVLLIDRLLGLRNPAMFNAVDERLPDAPACFGHRLIDAKGQAWQELDLQALSTEPEFMAIAA